MATEGFAPAKINLSLHVTGQRADGYHLLDSLVAFADVGDRLWFEPADALSLEVCGPFSEGVPADARNLVWQAADAAGWSGHIRLEKNLPNGAGIGGGSADAAAVLRYLQRPDLAPALGADVSVCLKSFAQRMQGIGEVLTPTQIVPQVSAVLVNPGVGLATPKVFNQLSNKNNPPMAKVLPTVISTADALTFLGDQRNDLEGPAINVLPLIQDVLDVLNATPNAKLSRMSGSGATCFALFEDRVAAKQAAQTVQHAHPDWWVADCVLS
jgi:4-diphosphocytidyl-2-C-methyl-D-erythritol kinase